MNRFSRFPRGASPSPAVSSPVSLVILPSSAYTVGTLLPTTTWNWPPARITVITPGSFSTAAWSALFSSRSFSRSRVAQWVAEAMFSSPPTS